MKEEILINTQLALFFEQQIPRPDELIQGFNQQMNNIFDKIPNIMPIPDGLNIPDVPIVQLMSKSNVHNCNIAMGRVDFFHTGINKQKFSDIKDIFLVETEKLYSFFSQKTPIKRIGFVTRFFFEDPEKSRATATLLNESFKNLFGSEILDTSIKFVTRINILDFEVNNATFVNSYTAKLPNILEKAGGILVTRDFSTNPMQDYSKKFDSDGIKKILTESHTKFNLDKIAHIIWP
jgi:hypothetical protein